ncbi:hypothetical protein RSAG8_06038, partial [Rhizoctonia solani AG-8 WAC10335]
MPTRIHPHWARTLDAYIHSYDFAAAQARVILAPDKENDALRDILKGTHNFLRAKNLDEVTLLDWISILRLSTSPLTFHHFVDTPLIGGWVKLMGTVKTSSKSSLRIRISMLQTAHDRRGSVFTEANESPLHGHFEYGARYEYRTTTFILRTRRARRRRSDKPSEWRRLL